MRRLLTVQRRVVRNDFLDIRERYRSALRSSSVGMPVITGFDYEEDPTNPGFVRKIYDINNPGHYFEQTTHASQYALPVPHADYGWLPCYVSTGVQWYQSNLDVEDWVFGHNGSGALVVCTATMTGATAAALLATKAPGQTGFALTHTAASSNLLGMTVSNGATNLISISITCPRDVPRQIAFSYLEGGGTPEYRFSATGLTTLTGDSTSAPSAGNSTRSMVIGRYADLTSSPFVGRIQSVIFAPSAVHRAQIQSVQRAFTGVAP